MPSGENVGHVSRPRNIVSDTSCGDAGVFTSRPGRRNHPAVTAMTTAEESVATSTRLARGSAVTAALGTDSATCGSCDRCNQAVAGLGDRLDDPWLLRIVVEQAAQLRNGPSQDVVGHGGVGPGGVKQAVLGHHLPCPRGEADEDLHHLGFQASDAVRACHPVERRLDVVGVADPKRVLHGPTMCQKISRTAN